MNSAISLLLRFMVCSIRLVKCTYGIVPGLLTWRSIYGYIRIYPAVVRTFVGCLSRDIQPEATRIYQAGRSGLIEGINHLPVALHIHHRPAAPDCDILRFVQFSIGEVQSSAYSPSASVWCTSSMKRLPSPAAVHCSICKSPSELPKATIGRRPMNLWMPTGRD